jgi:glycosyltransferase involved in cell wall biosynthesis
MNGDIFVAVCTLGTVRAEWAVGLASMEQPQGRTMHLSLIQNMGIADARNVAVNAACAAGADYLLFWDDDVVPRQTDAARQLITALDEHPEVDVVGAVYPMRRDSPEPVVVEHEGEAFSWCWSDGGIHPVFMTGTAFMAMRVKRLINDTTPPAYSIPGIDVLLGEYFRIEEREDGLTTDDFWFAGYCKHWGLRQYVHGGVICDQVQPYGEFMRVGEAVLA